MQIANAARSVMRTDVDITLKQGEIVESRTATHAPEAHPQIPSEVRDCGPAAVAAYQEYLDRVGSDLALNQVQHIEVSVVD